uniref:Translin n=1 Tax=Chromera velia CCMP2878 TaxID=1169474 RepID=A0A0G4I567_9ALVE|eukprot:Cvel_11108.t1-p1 / transcript=Cvel_11108.t1 / gene=Cvel_11108 / organism=Chromera_velia_CCMP2878 / gene_product=hypothetical protein / transcript_product=hypothetical protein / location=Cvel_scaffold687:43928-46975(-) / protein_length=318 / sequence_SO=supercontig / SO=protein_coding / is_pseudo=false
MRVCLVFTAFTSGQLLVFPSGSLLHQRRPSTFVFSGDGNQLRKRRSPLSSLMLMEDTHSSSFPADSPGGKEGSSSSSSLSAAEENDASSPLVLDISDFEEMRASMKEEDVTREELIKNSRDVLKASKNAIYAVHRRDFERAAKLIEEARGKIDALLLPSLSLFPSLRSGIVEAAFEEFSEAVIFQTFVKQRRIIPRKDVGAVSRTEYLGGVLDFTGELNRYAVARATKRDVEEVRRCASLVDELMFQFLQFDFRNSDLRRKFDTLKYTQKKLESLLYELSLAGTAFVSGSRASQLEGPEAAAAEGRGGSGEKDKEAYN